MMMIEPLQELQRGAWAIWPNHHHGDLEEDSPQKEDQQKNHSILMEEYRYMYEIIGLGG